MSDEKRTPAEEARAFVEETFPALAEPYKSRAIYRLTPVFERAQAVPEHLAEMRKYQEALAECYRLAGADPDGNEDWRLAPYAVDEVRALRDRAERAEADYKEADRGCVELLEKIHDMNTELAETQRERDEARRERDECVRKMKDAIEQAYMVEQGNMELRTDLARLRAQCDDWWQRYIDTEDALVRLHVREGQLREAIEWVCKDDEIRKKECVTNGIPWSQYVFLSKLLSSPPDAPDVVGAIRAIIFMLQVHDKQCDCRAEHRSTEWCASRLAAYSALATLRAAGIVE